MSVTQRLDLRQAQSLVMTPQLRQAIALLQMSTVELDQYVGEVIEANPLLDRDDPAPEEGAGDPATTAGERDGRDDNPDDWEADAWSHEGEDGPAMAVGYEDGLAGINGSARNGFEGGELDPFASLSAAPGLRAHLGEQAACDLADPADRLIAEQLIGLIDETGRLGPEWRVLADQLGTGHDRVEAVLAKLQRCDPAGVFARDLSECLALQLRERDRLDPAMEMLIDHLDLVARCDFGALKRLCRVDGEDLRDMLDELRSLDPKPGLRFADDRPVGVVPDVLMRADGAGWRVELNTANLPRVLVNRAYLTTVQAGCRKREDKAYLNEQVAQANWLTKALDQRAQTILKVAAEIVRRQDGFFRQGVRALKPLVLREVAEAIGMHESTVSRVTTNKFIATPRGTFELKYFFTVALASSSGSDSHSAEAVRYRIKAMIEGETADAILSDDQIVMRLRAEGIDLARRTVAKYRDQLGIGSSAQRRRRVRSAGAL